MKKWYDSVFDGDYDRFTFHLFTDESNRRESDFIRTALNLIPGDTVLDAPCGYGRHAALLAANGIHVTGIDNNDRYITRAIREALPDAVDYWLMDLRKMKFREQFDAAYCFYSSFGFFEDDENVQVLRQFSNSLKPGGLFLLDVQNRENFVGGNEEHQEFSELEMDGRKMTLLSESDFDILTGRLTVRLAMYGGDAPEEMTFDMRLYTLAELNWMLNRTGFDVEEVYGDYEGSHYEAGSNRCIVVSRRRG